MHLMALSASFAASPIEVPDDTLPGQLGIGSVSSYFAYGEDVPEKPVRKVPFGFCIERAGKQKRRRRKK